LRGGPIVRASAAGTQYLIQLFSMRHVDHAEARYHDGMAATATPRKSSRTGSAVTVVLVLVLAWQLAYWTWVFVTPPAISSGSPAPAGEVDMAAIARLFGAAPPVSSAAPSSGSLRLKGVIAPTPGVVASAIFSAGGGRDIAVPIQGEVQPGVKLAEVHPDHVVLSRGGIQSRLELEQPRSAVTTKPGARQQGFRLNVARSGANNYSLSRSELDGALKDPNQLNYLGQLGMPTSGGVRLEQAPPGSLAQKLGLQPGDVIKKVNGQAIASTGDLARVYAQFNTVSLIQAEVQRGASTVHLSYALQP
jgi:general secretion pathway protein C